MSRAWGFDVSSERGSQRPIINDRVVKMAKGSGRKRWPSAYNAIDVHVGARLRARRRFLRLSQTAVGNAIGVSFQQLRKYENGHNRISAGRLYDLAQVLGVDIAYFFDEIDPATHNESPVQVRHRESKQSFQEPSGSEDPFEMRETWELVQAYYKISNPTVRDHFRSLVQSAASASSPPA